MEYSVEADVRNVGVESSLSRVEGKNYCKLCGIRFYREIQMQQHLHGKKHVKKVAASQQPFGLSVASTTKTEQQEKLTVLSHAGIKTEPLTVVTNDDTKPSKTKDVGKNFDCTLCGVVFNGYIPYKQHLQGKKHEKKLASYQFFAKSASSSVKPSLLLLENIVSSEPYKQVNVFNSEKHSAVPSETSLFTKLKDSPELPASSGGAADKLSPLPLVTDEENYIAAKLANKVAVSSVDQITMTNTALASTENKNESTLSTSNCVSSENGQYLVTFCKLCQICLSGQANAGEHYRGQFHKAAEKQKREIETFYQVTDPSISYDQLHHNLSCLPCSRFITDIKDENLRYCKLCELVLTSDKVAETHYAGKSHLKKVEEQNLQSLQPTILDVPELTTTETAPVRQAELQIGDHQSFPSDLRRPETKCTFVSANQVATSFISGHISKQVQDHRLSVRESSFLYPSDLISEVETIKKQLDVIIPEVILEWEVAARKRDSFDYDKLFSLFPTTQRKVP